MRTTITLAVGIMLAAGSAQAADDLKFRDRVHTLDDTTACRTVVELEKYLRLALQDDYVAAMKARAGCAILPKGTAAVVEQTYAATSMMRPSELICIRPEGEPDCLWVGRRMVGP